MKNRNRSYQYRQNRLQSNQWSITSNTPKQPIIQEITKKQSDINLEFVKILDKRKKKVFNELIRESRGRNNPVKYEHKFDFLQRWETFSKQSDFHNVNYQMPQNLLGLIINIIFLIQKTVVVWFLSLYRLYNLTNYYWPFVLGLIFVFFKIVWKIIIVGKHYVSFKKDNNQNMNSSEHFQELVELFSFDIYTVIYYIFTISISEFRQGFLGLIIFDYLTAFSQYNQGQKLYKKIKLFGIRSTYRNYMNLFDLISNLFIIFHFCAIIIYSLTLFSQNNWINHKIQIDDQCWYSKYIYSLYFTSTTMLTVGYGDITPTNQLQIMTIILIQVLGTATNGYIFSQVGHTLSKIRLKKQTQEKDISDTQKLAKVYRLDNELAKKMRSYIVNNEMQNQQLNIQQENNLLHKLNNELRTEVNNYNHMQIVKENIFFLFYFSKKAQIQFAKRLLRKLFSPNQTICQISGKQKLFIVTKGKLEIYTDRKQGMKFYCKKKLKQINKIQKQQISDNIFGYSSIICGKPTNLRAVTKDFTVIYNLEKTDMLQVIHDDSNDFQSFCQLKEKIMLQKYPQRWQVPRITSIRQHYQPSIFFLIKKQKSLMKKLVQRQRKERFRTDRRCKRLIPISVNDFQSDNDSSQQSLHSSENIIPIDETGSKVIAYQQREDKYTKIKQLQSNQYSLKSIVPRSYKRKYVNNKKYDEKHRQELIQKWQISKETQNMKFQIFKNFNSFFKKRNLSEVIKKLKNKDMIQTQLTMIGETLSPFHPKRHHFNRVSNY